MNVRELIEELQGFDPEAIVIASKDDEGNGYSAVEPSPTLVRVWEESWRHRPDQKWLEFEPVHPDDIKSGEYEEDEIAGFVPGVCFWPSSIVPD